MAEDTSITYKAGSRINTTVDATSVREAALYTGQLTPLLMKQYSLFIFDTFIGAVALGGRFDSLNPAVPNAPPEYFFDVAPQVIDLGEPFAMKITPTQRGGKFVEGHGSLVKNLMVKGTTGVRPNKKRGEFSGIPLIGETINDLTNKFDLGDVRRNVKSTEQTGFDSITFLRNIFRAYSDVKENSESSNHIVMVWRNNKDEDSWIVEPQDFKSTRSSKSPLTYEYQFQLKTLAPLVVILRQDTIDPLAKVLAARKVFSRVREFNESIRNSFLIVSTQIRRLEGLGVYAQTQLVSPMINVTRGLGIIRHTGAIFGQRLKQNTEMLAQELDNAIDLLTGSPGIEPQDALVRSLRRTRITCSRILTEPGVRESVGSESGSRQSRQASAYVTGSDSIARSLSVPDTGGSSTFIGNKSASSSVAQGTVHHGEDIRGIAGRLLGDKASWHILASINGLTSPYISADGTGNTLKVGDPILYPSENGVGVSGINTVSDSALEAEGLSPMQHAYGRDIRLESVPAGLTDLADFYVNQRGDISTIVGIANIEQAIVLKFSTERGELPVHTYYGASFPIGSKMGLNSISDFRTQTEATIYSDKRVLHLNKLDFTSSGDVLVVNAAITLINNSDSLNLTIPIRRL